MAILPAEVRLKKLRRILEHLYGIRLNFEKVSPRKFESLYEEYSKLKETILKENDFNSYHENPEYSKILLILEAVRIYLSEIAPKRLNRRRLNKNKSE